MSSKKIPERAKQYFLRAEEKYDPMNGGDIFNDEYTVPAELLFEDMCEYAKVLQESYDRVYFRQIFDARLKELITKNKNFDLEYLSTEILKVIKAQTKKDYSVYFSVPVKITSGHALPFERGFKSQGLNFFMVSEKAFQASITQGCLKEYNEKIEGNLKKNQRYPLPFNKIIYFKVSVSAQDKLAAVNMAADGYRDIVACASVAETSFRYNQSFGFNGQKSRSILNPSGVYIAKDLNEDTCEVLWSSDIRPGAEQTIKFPSDATKLKLFKLYREVFKGSTPIDKRIQMFLYEYTDAMHELDPHIRQLSLWRCLEIATSKQGSSRQEKDIVNILGNYYSKSWHWKPQGKIIKNIRNRYVHSGAKLESDVFGSVDKYLNWSQLYADHALAILRWMRRNNIGKDSEAEIDSFFDHYSQPDSSLEIAIKLLNARKKAS